MRQQSVWGLVRSCSSKHNLATFRKNGVVASLVTVVKGLAREKDAGVRVGLLMLALTICRDEDGGISEYSIVPLDFFQTILDFISCHNGPQTQARTQSESQASKRQLSAGKSESNLTTPVASAPTATSSIHKKRKLSSGNNATSSVHTSSVHTSSVSSTTMKRQPASKSSSISSKSSNGSARTASSGIEDFLQPGGRDEVKEEEKEVLTSRLSTAHMSCSEALTWMLELFPSLTSLLLGPGMTSLGRSQGSSVAAVCSDEVLDDLCVVLGLAWVNRVMLGLLHRINNCAAMVTRKRGCKSLPPAIGQGGEDDDGGSGGEGEGEDPDASDNDSLCGDRPQDLSAMVTILGRFQESSSVSFLNVMLTLFVQDVENARLRKLAQKQQQQLNQRMALSSSSGGVLREHMFLTKTWLSLTLIEALTFQSARNKVHYYHILYL